MPQQQRAELLQNTKQTRRVPKLLRGSRKWWPLSSGCISVRVLSGKWNQHCFTGLGRGPMSMKSTILLAVWAAFINLYNYIFMNYLMMLGPVELYPENDIGYSVWCIGYWSMDFHRVLCYSLGCFLSVWICWGRSLELWRAASLVCFSLSFQWSSLGLC